MSDEESIKYEIARVIEGHVIAELQRVLEGRLRRAIESGLKRAIIEEVESMGAEELKREITAGLVERVEQAVNERLERATGEELTGAIRSAIERVIEAGIERIIENPKAVGEAIQRALGRLQTSTRDKIPFPTPEWLDEYVRRLNGSEEFAESGKGWGVGWNGDFVFQIDDLPLEKIEKLPGEDLKRRVRGLVEKYVRGKTVCTHIRLKDGRCLGARVVEDPSEVKAEFRLVGSYECWKRLARAEINAAQAITAGMLKLDGDMGKVLHHIRATQTMSRVASEVPTEFIDELVP